MGGESEKTALEQLYDAALEREMEILRLRQEAAKLANPEEPIDPVRAAIIASGQPAPESEPPQLPSTAVEPDEFERWLTPPDAIKRLGPALSAGEAKAEIHRRLCEGEVLSNARTANWYKRGSIDIHDFERIGAFLWKVNDEPRDYDLLWKTGTHTLRRPEPTGYGNRTERFDVECFGIRFDPAGIDKILADAGVVPETQKAERGPGTHPRNPVGRPAKQLWEPLLIEMAAQLYGGDLQPKRQAEIEAAMHEWISAHGYSASETQVRERARKLWQQIEK